MNQPTSTQLAFNKLFASERDTWQYIYADRAKVADILGNETFIAAWLSSNRFQVVTGIIRDEALAGDLPSIKQMIWLCGLLYTKADTFVKDPLAQEKLKISALEDRIKFCDRAIALGHDQSYYAMTSSANLYHLLSRQKRPVGDRQTTRALRGIVEHARNFLASGVDDQDLVADANNLLQGYADLYEMISAFPEHG